jgi:prepilin-type N-terminal cleavage/methylation domain-containing protein
MLRPRDSRRGFTILELCLTLVLVSLIATISIWAYFSRAEVTLVNAAHLLVEDLRLAQSRAACLHTPVEVVFQPDASGYHIAAPENEGLPTEKHPRSYPTDAVFEGVRILTKRLPDPNRLVFDARGRIARDASITLTFRGETRTVVAHADGTVLLAEGS